MLDSELSTYRVTTLDQQVINVHARGKSPRTIFTTRYHGHELLAGESLDLVMSGRTSIRPESLGSYLYIPNAHPAAIAIRQRESPNGVDANRVFPNPYLEPNRPITEPVAIALAAETEKFRESLRTFWSFHGNIDQSDAPAQPFYLYSCTPTPENITQPTFMELVSQLLETISNNEQFKGPFKRAVYDGIDTPKLKNVVRNGIVHQVAQNEIDGTHEIYVTGASIRSNGIAPRLNVHRAVVFEIPAVLPQEVQTNMVEIIFSTLIIPYTNYVTSL